MTEAEAIEKLKAIRERSGDDYEEGHSDADDVLRNFLRALGYAALVREYDKQGKWYA